MPKHIVKESHELDAWKGTPGEMADLFERALQLATEADPEGEGRSLSVTVEIDNDEVRFDDPSEFREYGQVGKLAAAKEVTAHVSGWKDSVSVMIMLRGRYREFSGASVSVSGTNHVAVSGLVKQLGQQLDKGKRHRPKNRWVVSVGFLAVLAIAFSGGEVSRNVSSSAGWTLSGLALLISAAIGSSYFTIPLVVPGLEILDPKDPRSRYERWRKFILGGVWGLLLVAVGAILQAVLQK